MRVLVLHSDVAPDAPPDEQDTLLQAAAIEASLKALGHGASVATFILDPAKLGALVQGRQADVVFNLVESVWGRGAYAPVAAQMLTELGIAYTGARGATLAATSDKLLSKRLMAGAGLPTAAWSEGPGWNEIGASGQWIVKSADEDASLGLDEHAVVCGAEAVMQRAAFCGAKYGGRWFAEAYIDGREFNVAMYERDGGPVVLPIGEMIFEDWKEDRPRIVGYAAKWDAAATEYQTTPRVFDWNTHEAELYATLEQLSKQCWELFGCRGYARVDFRVDKSGHPFILEVNANPCLEPEAGFAAAAERAGLTYGAIVEQIVRSAV